MKRLKLVMINNNTGYQGVFKYLPKIKFNVLSILKHIIKSKKEDTIKKLSKAIRSLHTTVVIITDIKGNIEYANPYFIELTGYSPEEYLGKNPKILKSGIHSNEYYKDLWEKITSGKIWEGEFQNKKKNGDLYWEKATISPVKNNKGKIINFVAVKTDITRQKMDELLLAEKTVKIEAQKELLIQINKELFEAKRKAEESDRLKTLFLQNISHEIRTPLNAIIGFSEILHEYYNDKPKLERFSDIITRRSHELLNIINDILDISIIEAGQLPVNINECNLNELFAELNGFFIEHQKRIEKTQIKFNLQLPSSTSETVVLTDRIKLKQILINLIGNAFKFTRKGTIETGFKYVPDCELIFFVSDTGIGIQHVKHHVIFEQFIQAAQNSDGTYGGTGLGLSIVKGLVHLLNGKIWLESDPGKGTTFYFSIPAITGSTHGVDKKMNPGNNNSYN